MASVLYTQEQLDIALLNQKNGEIFRSLDRIEKTQKWMLGLLGTGFITLLGLIAHGMHLGT